MNQENQRKENMIFIDKLKEILLYYNGDDEYDGYISRTLSSYIKDVTVTNKSILHLFSCEGIFIIYDQYREIIEKYDNLTRKATRIQRCWRKNKDRILKNNYAPGGIHYLLAQKRCVEHGMSP